MRDSLFSFDYYFFLSALIFGVVYLHPLGSIISRNAFSKEALFVKSILVWSFWIKSWAVGIEIRPWGRWNSFMNHDGVTYCCSHSLFKKTYRKLSLLLLVSVIVYCSDINQWLRIYDTFSSSVLEGHRWREDHLILCKQDLFWQNFWSHFSCNFKNICILFFFF